MMDEWVVSHCKRAWKVRSMHDEMKNTTEAKLVA